MKTEELSAGRELDALVAGVLGCEWIAFDERERKWWGQDGHFRVPGLPDDVLRVMPSYSTDIADAWRVVEHLREQGWVVKVQEMPAGQSHLPDGTPAEGAEPYTWSYCALYPGERMQRALPQGRHYFRPMATASTAPMAICKCALELAVSQEVSS